jgi:Tat protein secretion system quality control protein TatD with DNase activity
MNLFDSHCHLQDERLAADLDGVLRRAAAAGVRGCMCCGSAEADWAAVRDVQRRHPRVAVVGLGAVGSYAVEALARAGVGHLRLHEALQAITGVFSRPA